MRSRDLINFISINIANKLYVIMFTKKLFNNFHYSINSLSSSTHSIGAGNLAYEYRSIASNISKTRFLL